MYIICTPLCVNRSVFDEIPVPDSENGVIIPPLLSIMLSINLTDKRVANTLKKVSPHQGTPLKSSKSLTFKIQ